MILKRYKNTQQILQVLKTALRESALEIQPTEYKEEFFPEIPVIYRNAMFWYKIKYQKSNRICNKARVCKEDF